MPNNKAELQSKTTASSTADASFQETKTGSMLPQSHRIGALPVDRYSIESLHQQGITSAAGAVAQIPQNNPR